MDKYEFMLWISKYLPENIKILQPKKEGFGDYAINKNQLPENFNINTISQTNFIEKIELINGFYNFFIKEEYILKNLTLKKEKKQTPKTILIEFGQPNTHKLPHIGHLFSYIFGESLSRIIEKQGDIVKRLNYQGDIGLHVAKCLYAIINSEKNLNEFKEIKEKINFLQNSYQEGSIIYEKDDKSKEEINNINKQIYEKNTNIKALWETTRQWSLEYYLEFEKKLGTKYNEHYFESQTFEEGKKIVNSKVGEIFEKSDNAIIFKGDKYNLHTRVFINSLGLPTYEAKDIGLIALKNKDFKYDFSIVTTASEQNDYWKVIIKASELIFPNIKNKLIHLGFGMINLKSGKMSSRTGKILSALDLIEQVKEKIITTYKTTEEKAETIAFSAIKFSFLKGDYKKNITFDVDESISLNGFSGPYIQYTYARANSIIEKSQVNTLDFEYKNKLSKEELSLVKHLNNFDDIAFNAAKHYSPHIIANYLFELCQIFNLFYEKHPILSELDINKKQIKLFLTQKTTLLLKEGLYLLGIEALNKI